MAVVADKRTEGKFLAQYWDRTNTRVTPSFATRERAEFDMMINAGDMSLHLLGDIHFSGLMLYYEHVQKQRLLKDALSAPDPRVPGANPCCTNSNEHLVRPRRWHRNLFLDHGSYRSKFVNPYRDHSVVG